MSIKQLGQKINHNGASHSDPMISPFLAKITHLLVWVVAGIYEESNLFVCYLVCIAPQWNARKMTNQTRRAE
jgi:hypothetical protein